MQACLAGEKAELERRVEVLEETVKDNIPFLQRAMKLEKQLTALSSQRDELLKACAAFRDAVLNSRHQLEEPCLDVDQTNAVLDLFDDTIGANLEGVTK